MHLLLYVDVAVAAYFSCGPLSFAVHFRLFFSSPCRLGSPPDLISNNDLSKSSAPLIWLGAAWIKDRNTHLCDLISWPPVFFFFFPFRTLVYTERPIRWKQVLLSLEQVLMWHMCFLPVPFCVRSHFRLNLHYLISFLAVMSLQQQDMQRTQSTLRRFSPAFSLLCIVTRIQLNWSPGENLWERSPCTASQLSAGQRAAGRFAWRSIPHCVLKPTVPFRAAAEAVGMQGNISPFLTWHGISHPHLFIPSLALTVCIFHLFRSRADWLGAACWLANSPTQRPKLMAIGKLIAWVQWQCISNGLWS